MVPSWFQRLGLVPWTFVVAVAVALGFCVGVGYETYRSGGANAISLESARIAQLAAEACDEHLVQCLGAWAAIASRLDAIEQKTKQGERQ